MVVDTFRVVDTRHWSKLRRNRMSAATVVSVRSLGFWRCWGLVVGGAIGTSVFMMPTVLAPYGYLGSLSLVAATAGAMGVALTMGHVARHVTVTGGPYAYTHAAFGGLPGFLVAWSFWISYWVALPAVALGFSAYAGTLVPAIAASPRLSAVTALAAIWATVAINCAGIRESGIVSLATSVLKITPIILLCMLGVAMVAPAWPPAPTAQGSPLMMFASVYALAFWNFVGIEAATIAADNVVDPARTIPRALVVGTATVGLIYLLVNLVSINVLGASALAASSAPLADVGRRLLGEPGAVLVALGALVSTAGCLNVSTLGTGQIAMAAARDQLFPSVFAQLSARHTPAISYVLAGCLSSTLLLFSFSDSLVGAWTFISLLATLTIVAPYAASALASIAFQRREGATTATGMGAAVVALVTCVWIIASSGVAVLAWGLVLLAAGLPVYGWLRLRGERINPGAGPSQPTALG
jgi:APA family basic amino acid/polyamine antiporter